jgi:hypothetical protein
MLCEGRAVSVVASLWIQHSTLYRLHEDRLRTDSRAAQQPRFLAPRFCRGKHRGMGEIPRPSMLNVGIGELVARYSLRLERQRRVA